MAPWQGTQHDRHTIDAEGDPQRRRDRQDRPVFPQEDRCLNMGNRWLMMVKDDG